MTCLWVSFNCGTALQLFLMFSFKKPGQLFQTVLHLGLPMFTVLAFRLHGLGRKPQTWGSALGTSFSGTHDSGLSHHQRVNSDLLRSCLPVTVNLLFSPLSLLSILWGDAWSLCNTQFIIILPSSFIKHWGFLSKTVITIVATKRCFF